MSENEYCDSCGAPVVEYTHSLSAALIKGLEMLADAGGGPINLRELGLSYSLRCNFQKLRYFGLVDSPKRGLWGVTPKGHAFLQGLVAVPPKVTTFRATPIHTEGKPIFVHEAVGGFDEYEDYVASRVAHVL